VHYFIKPSISRCSPKRGREEPISIHNAALDLCAHSSWVNWNSQMPSARPAPISCCIHYRHKSQGAAAAARAKEVKTVECALIVNDGSIYLVKRNFPPFLTSFSLSLYPPYSHTALNGQYLFLARAPGTCWIISTRITQLSRKSLVSFLYPRIYYVVSTMHINRVSSNTEPDAHQKFHSAGEGARALSHVFGGNAARGAHGVQGTRPAGNSLFFLCTLLAQRISICRRIYIV